MAQIQYLSIPGKTEDLVQRLRSSDTHPEEKLALQAWTQKMIKTFEDQPRPSYIPEASELASVVAANDYQRLLSALKNMIIRGTSDNDIIPSELLMKFKSVLSVC